jgi:molybdate transport system permease protein
MKRAHARENARTLRLPGFSLLVGVLAVIAGLFLTLPLISLLVRALDRRAWEGLPASAIPDAIALSAFTTACTLALTLVFGTPLAYALARSRFPLRRVLNVVVELPIVLPPAVAGLALLVAFGRRGLLGPVLGEAGIALAFTTAAVVMAQTFVAAPFFIRAAQVAFTGVPREIEEAARVDGAGGFALFWWVTLPLTGRALAAGAILSWARALGEFGATLLFAGSLQGSTQTMPLLIYAIIERDLDAALWAGLLLIGLALGALLAAHALAARTGEGDAAAQPGSGAY